MRKIVNAAKSPSPVAWLLRVHVVRINVMISSEGNLPVEQISSRTQRNCHNSGFKLPSNTSLKQKRLLARFMHRINVRFVLSYKIPIGAFRHLQLRLDKQFQGCCFFFPDIFCRLS